MRLLPLVILVLVPALAGSANAESSTGSPCDRKDVVTSGAGSWASVQVQHKGFPTRFVICILDMAESRVASMRASGTGNNLIGTTAELPPGRYLTIVEAYGAGPASAGSGVASQEIDVRTCRNGTTTAVYETHHWPWGFSIAARGVACVPNVQRPGPSLSALHNNSRLF